MVKKKKKTRRGRRGRGKGKGKGKGNGGGAKGTVGGPMGGSWADVAVGKASPVSWAGVTGGAKEGESKSKKKNKKPKRENIQRLVSRETAGSSIQFSLADLGLTSKLGKKAKKIVATDIKMSAVARKVRAKQNKNKTQRGKIVPFNAKTQSKRKKKKNRKHISRLKRAILRERKRVTQTVLAAAATTADADDDLDQGLTWVRDLIQLRSLSHVLTALGGDKGKGGEGEGEGEEGEEGEEAGGSRHCGGKGMGERGVGELAQSPEKKVGQRCACVAWEQSQR